MFSIYKYMVLLSKQGYFMISHMERQKETVWQAEALLSQLLHLLSPGISELQHAFVFQPTIREPVQ